MAYTCFGLALGRKTACIFKVRDKTVACLYRLSLTVPVTGNFTSAAHPGGGGVLPEKLSMGVRPAYQNPYPIYDQNGGKMAKIDTRFMTKMAEKPYHLGPHIPI